MEADRTDPIIEALGNLGSGAVQGLGSILGGVFEMAGRIIQGIEEQPDPIAQVALVATGILTLAYFCNTPPYKDIMRRLKLDGLCRLFPVPGSGREQLTGAINDCIAHIQEAGFKVPDQFYQLRDTVNAFDVAHQLDNLLGPGGNVVATLLSPVLFTVEGLQSAAYSFLSDKVREVCDAYIMQQNLLNQWVITGEYPPGSGVRIVIATYPTEAAANKALPGYPTFAVNLRVEKRS